MKCYLLTPWMDLIWAKRFPTPQYLHPHYHPSISLIEEFCHINEESAEQSIENVLFIWLYWWGCSPMAFVIIKWGIHCGSKATHSVLRHPTIQPSVPTDK